MFVISIIALCGIAHISYLCFRFWLDHIQVNIV
ncbi:hypothetical protein VA7868_00211 [Vibrio aerogenes CECT 7868]|uniref:Uncharacterized protein n=1 Tax=Vibrio aerogenes CECT 7868 TaxID=1216006 RepID=A0A1M5UXZ4_9VIBR|nr:hypothetical protein VA7868_00211 [Vibrio aerogenes CECT 7868]